MAASALSMGLSSQHGLQAAWDMRDGVSCFEIPYGAIEEAGYALPGSIAMLTLLSFLKGEP
jgi:hypothetical protein